VSAGPRSLTFDATAEVFRRRCVACHGPEDASGGLRLDSYQNVMQGGEQGPAIIAGNPRASLLFQKILRRDQPAMPPRKRLTRRDLERIRTWIEGGAPP
jgi:mono/diheme cytochrome c family protein